MLDVTKDSVAYGLRNQQLWSRSVEGMPCLPTRSHELEIHTFEQAVT